MASVTNRMHGLNAIFSRTPTVECFNRLREEATKEFGHSAKCQSIALTMHDTSPILPFSTIPITFE
jgi:hypothetical protein